MSHTQKNLFLHTPIHRLFIQQLLPMLLVMLMNGLFNLIDAMFLGHYVGADALTAVNVVFPFIMLTIALSSLVSGGLSSLLARYLGAKQTSRAESTFAQAHGLSLFIALLLIVVYLCFGQSVLAYLRGQANASVIAMAHSYLLILMMATPIQFFLGIHADAWRNEGHVALIAMLSVGITLANIVLNYLLIAVFQFGVAGSAYGTLFAQLLGLSLLVLLRAKRSDVIPMTALRRYRWFGEWRDIFQLGTPLSLSFIGIMLVSTTVILTLRQSDTADYASQVTAYGIVTRLFSFAFLALMAIALTTQSIIGNNVGAGLKKRSDATLRFAVLMAFGYCVLVEVALLVSAQHIGALFLSQADIIAKTAEILTIMIFGYVVVGPVLVLAMYFQAVGQPLRTALLTLVKPFVFTPMLIIGLAVMLGKDKMWYAFPVADSITAIIAVWVVMSIRANQQMTGFGLKREK